MTEFNENENVERIRQQEQPKTLASPFSYDSLLMRIADSNDYTNALLNGVLNRLEALCKALGVIE